MAGDCTFAPFAQGMDTRYNLKESSGPEGKLSTVSWNRALKPEPAQRV